MEAPQLADRQRDKPSNRSNPREADLAATTKELWPEPFLITGKRSTLSDLSNDPRAATAQRKS